MRLVILFLFALPRPATLPVGFRGLTAPPLAVHATLVSSEPAANSHLPASPPRVRLVYSEPVEGGLARVTIVPGAGAPIVLRAAGDPRDVHAVIAPVDSLAPGRYRLDWRVVSADGHAVDGTFAFAVGDTTLGSQTGPPPPPPAEPEQGMEMEPEADVWGPSVAGAPLIPALLRGVGLGAVMAAAGLLLFLAFAGPDATQTGDRRLGALTTGLAIAAPVFLAAHLLSWLVNTSPDHVFDAAWAASALTTTVGKTELWRTGLAVLMLWAWWIARRPRLALAFGIAALAVSGASGHSAAIQPFIGVPAKAIHLLASAVWFGGLLWLVVRPANDSFSLFAKDADRVSSRALLAVVAVAFSGVVQTVLFLPSLGDIATSPYGWFALAKTAGLLVLVGFGAYHRQRLMPRIAAGGTGDGATLRASVAREIFIMTLVILLGGVLAYVPPPGEDHDASMSTHSSTS
jgi:copper transport protein